MTIGIRDQLDDLLTGYFRPEATPADLASRIARSAQSAEADLGEIAQRLSIRATAQGVSLIREGRPSISGDVASQRVADQAREEIVEYLRGQRVFFSVAVDLSETPPFQRRVLEAARQIPFGEARAYGWVAGRVGSPRAVRAVGTALGKNPVPLIVPCHRVWRSDGSLGGYLFGEALKRRLLHLERSTPVLEGSTSTRLVCRVGCGEGRHTRPEHRIVFASVEDARSVGYRPCKVCRPSAAA